MKRQSNLCNVKTLNFRVFAAAHQYCDQIPCGYEIVQAGAEGKMHFALLSDDSGDNISNRNPEYCEMTVLYWIWKNISADYIGFVHYRRFFYENTWSCSYSKIPTREQLIKLLGNHDILVAKPHFVEKNSVKQEYEYSHHISDLLIARSFIRQTSPEYVEAFDAFMKMDKMSYYNMFVAKEDIFHEYMTWVFPILDYCYEHIDFSQYDSYNKRVIGFIAERLFNVWLIANSQSLKIAYAPVQQAYISKTDIVWHTFKGYVATLLGKR